MKESRESGKNIPSLVLVQRNIDLIIATLLLTGQITIIGVFVTPGGFRVSVGGPLTGRPRLEGKYGAKSLSFIIDGIDIILAILLFINAINVTGTFIGSGDFSVNISGPIFGVPKHDFVLPQADTHEFLTFISANYNVDPKLVTTSAKE